MTFKGKSDCEILLPLYQKMGVDMFEELDGEFALILFDGDTKEFIAARDPIGIRHYFMVMMIINTLSLLQKPKI